MAHPIQKWKSIAGREFETEQEAINDDIAEWAADEYGMYASGRQVIRHALSEMLAAGWVIQPPSDLDLTAPHGDHIR